MLYRPRFFAVKELVDPGTYASLGERSLQVFSTEALKMLDGLRDFLGVPLQVNTWHHGGPRKWSGYRPPECKVGAKHSAHRLGEGFDVLPVGMTVVAAWAKMKGAPKDPRLQLIRRVEDPKATMTWLHVDRIEHDGVGILVIPMPKQAAK